MYKYIRHIYLEYIYLFEYNIGKSTACLSCVVCVFRVSYFVSPIYTFRILNSVFVSAMLQIKYSQIIVYYGSKKITLPDRTTDTLT